MTPLPRLLALLVPCVLVASACSDDDAGELVDAPTEDAGAPGTTTSTEAGPAVTPDASSPADSGPPAEVFRGEATYYNANGTGACGQPTQNSALVGALNGAQYSKANCGRCASIQGPLGTVVVKLQDKCPGCDFGDIDLSSTAFQKIAKLADGRVKITWSFTTCP